MPVPLASALSVGVMLEWRVLVLRAHWRDLLANMSRTRLDPERSLSILELCAFLSRHI